MGYFWGIMFGLAFGTGFAFFVIITLVRRSNDIGSTTGKLKDFGTLKVIGEEDDLHSGRGSVRGKMILESRREAVFYNWQMELGEGITYEES